MPPCGRLLHVHLHADSTTTYYTVTSGLVVVKKSRSFKLTDVQRGNVLYFPVKKLQLTHSLRTPTNRKGEESFMTIDRVTQPSSQTAGFLMYRGEFGYIYE
jgi:hypothetical protein